MTPGWSANLTLGLLHGCPALGFLEGQGARSHPLFTKKGLVAVRGV